MPYIDVETEFDLSVDEFLSECSSNEIRELIDALIEDGHIPPITKGGTNLTFNHKIFNDSMIELSSKYLSLSNEDLITLENLFKKYL